MTAEATQHCPRCGAAMKSTGESEVLNTRLFDCRGRWIEARIGVETLLCEGCEFTTHDMAAVAPVLMQKQRHLLRSTYESSISCREKLIYEKADKRRSWDIAIFWFLLVIQFHAGFASGYGREFLGTAISLIVFGVWGWRVASARKLLIGVSSRIEAEARRD